MKTGIELIAAERNRQVVVEGFTADHDKGNTHNALPRAAACYAIGRPFNLFNGFLSSVGLEDVPRMEPVWPWDAKWWKPTPDNRIRELVKAGALIAAEIDRLASESESEASE